MAGKKAKRSDGRYQASVMLGRDSDGKVVRKYFYGKTQREANAKKNAFLDGDRKIKAIAVADWCDKWVSSYPSGGFRNKANTASIINKFKEAMGRKKVCDVQPVDIQKYARSQAGFSKSHVDKVRRTLNSLFDAAVENGHIATNPCRGIAWDYVKTGTHKVVPPEIVKLINDYWKIHPAGLWAMIMLYAGLRPSEVFALKREDITDDFINVHDGSHFENGRLVIVPDNPKSAAGMRSIPVLPKLRICFSALPPSGLICTRAEGKPLTEAAVRSGWHCLWNMLEELYNGRVPHMAGRRSDKFPRDWKYLPDIKMYDLRHTYCSMLYDADVDVKTAQYLMGHASLEMTLKIYTHLSEQKKQRSYDKLFEYVDVKNDVRESECPDK